MGQLGRNAHGQVLKPGRVLDCHLGLLLDRAYDDQGAAVLVVAPAALLHPGVPQPDGTVLYELLTGHPDRTPGQLVFVADLTVELRAWPTDSWAKVGVDPQRAAGAVIAAWHRGDIRGLRLDGLTAEEALAVERPAMTYLRAQLADRLDRRIAQAQRRWRSVAADGDRTPASGSAGHPGHCRCPQSTATRPASDTGRADIRSCRGFRWPQRTPRPGRPAV